MLNVEIISIEGNLHWRGSFHGMQVENRLDIPVANLSPGVYVLKTIHPAGQQIFRFIKAN
jgi:hypothetical protein